MESTNLSDQHSKSDAIVPSGVHGQHRPVNDEYLPKSVWQPGVVRRLADYIQHLREVDDESNKRPLTRKSSESAKPEQSRHVCTRNPHRTCNCYAGVCADDDATYRYARGPFLSTDPRISTTNQFGDFHCPISGQPCSSNVCREWCEGSGAGTKTDTNRGDASSTNNR